MKKLLLPIFIISVLSYSCETKEASKDEPKKTVKVSTDIYLDVNDAIIEKVEKAQLILDHLSELDANNVSEAEMILAAETAKTEITGLAQEITEIVPVGKGGEEYLSAAVEFLYVVSSVTQVYIDFAPALSIVEDDWSELQVQEWFNLAEPIFMDYMHVYKELVTQQSNYAALQNIEIDLLKTESDTLEEEIIPETI